jgi:hypothetical protein
MWLSFRDLLDWRADSMDSRGSNGEHTLFGESPPNA